MKVILLIFILFLPSCSSMVYTKTKFCILCWEQIVDSENNPHGDGDTKFFKPNVPADKASTPNTVKER